MYIKTIKILHELLKINQSIKISRKIPQFFLSYTKHTQKHSIALPGSFFSLLGLGPLFTGADGVDVSSPVPSTGVPLNSSSNSTFTTVVSGSPYVLKNKSNPIMSKSKLVMHILQKNFTQ